MGRAGRPVGSTGERVLAIRRLYHKHVAREARRAWRLARARFVQSRDPRDDPGPEPPKDNEDAAVGFLVRMLVAKGIAGSAELLIHLDERVAGRVRQEIAVEGSLDPVAPPDRKYIATLAGGRPALPGPVDLEAYKKSRDASGEKP